MEVEEGVDEGFEVKKEDAVDEVPKEDKIEVWYLVCIVCALILICILVGRSS